MLESAAAWLRVGARAFLILLAPFLAGCAAVAIPSDVPAIPATATPKQLLDRASAVSVQYGQISDQLKRDELWIDMPLLGAAVAAAAVLFYAKPPALKNEAFGIALGAGGLTALRTYFNPGTVADAYAQAGRQLSCVVGAGLPLSAAAPTITAGVSTDSPLIAKLKQDEKTLNDLLQDKNVGKLTPDPATASAQVVKDASAALAAAVTSGNAAVALAEREKSAVDNASSLLASTLADIDNALRAQLSHNTIDYATLSQQLFGNAQQQAQAQQQKQQVQSTSIPVGTPPPSGLRAQGGPDPNAEAAKLRAAAIEIQNQAVVVTNAVGQTNVATASTNVSNCKATK